MCETHPIDHMPFNILQFTLFDGFCLSNGDWLFSCMSCYFHLFSLTPLNKTITSYP
jgi:hypothetical protein